MSEGIDVSNTPEELALSVVQSATPLRKPGRPRKADSELVHPRRDRTKARTQEAIHADNLAALPEAQRAELVALSDECRMAGRMMKDVAWLHIGYGEAGVDRIYPDLAFVDVKAHIKKSGGLIETYPKKDADNPESYRRYGLLTQIYRPEFLAFCWHVASWCHSHSEEAFDREVETECTLISGWRPQAQSVRSPKSVVAADNRSYQEKNEAEQKRKSDELLRGLVEAEQKISWGEEY